jgi:indolepyruvate ferredoxin oxidoreductase, beta subunit
MAEAKPIKVLVAALGGEGGGVLSSWIHKAAIASGHFIQSTSIPGVAQRTGATTYYLEIVPGAGIYHLSEGARPILALNAAPGEVDIMVASELLEAARAIQSGYVTPDRTLLIASTTRVFTVDEKQAMGDGRVDAGRMQELARRFSRRAIIADFADLAAAARGPLNALLLGVMAGAGELPISPKAFRAAVRSEGKAVDANLRGFEAGLALATTRAPPDASIVAPAIVLAEPDLAAFPSETHAVLREGLKRLIDYQDAAYARRYLARLRRFVGLPGADGPFLRELARHLAVRMSVEDVIRVAQLKLHETRLLRVTRQANARSGDIVDVTEYLKPGPEEILGLLPPRIGRALLERVRRDRAWPMKIRTTRLWGFLRLAALAELRRWRPRTLRFADEEAWVARWLGLVERTLAADSAAAREVVATAALVRGYAETYKRGHSNWHRIMDEIVEPMLSGRLPRERFADAVLQARLAASKDPDGDALAKTISAIGQMTGGGRLVAE